MTAAPADRLRAAAQRVRDAGGDLAQRVRDAGGDLAQVQAWFAPSELLWRLSPSVRTWMALLGPHTAEPIALVLDSAAEEAEHSPPSRQSVRLAAALDLADAILGTEAAA